jgi:transposase
MRAVMNGVMYILSIGCQWRSIPKHFPPRSTSHDYFTWWICDGTLDRIHHALCVQCREKVEREAKSRHPQNSNSLFAKANSSKRDLTIRGTLTRSACFRRRARNPRARVEMTNGAYRDVRPRVCRRTLITGNRRLDMGAVGVKRG